MLESLDFRKPVSVDTVGLLPVLREYTGSCETLHIFLPLGNLTRLTTTLCSSDDFMAQLQKTSPPHSITSLDVTFASFDNAAFSKLCDALPLLTELRIRINYVVELDAFQDGDNPLASRFFKRLPRTRALPPTLERLAISWYFEYESNEEPRGEEPLWDILVDKLDKQCPSLTSLWLDGHDFLFHWRKLEDLTVCEGFATDADDVETTREEEFVAFWELSSEEYAAYWEKK
ncbi:hypothetical protein B0H19DRAFT_1233602 [Mycena capillaripes]|nr:hypothetical protein B0H19DRAFT_1233602 [Mycena capillaripes]